jgi:transcriptional regulator with PAS, ATPase and Fis domain
LSASVLITGESGTGKELVARAIHNTGTRAGRPFVAVSCGAIPETLIEAELFGHERGAYTGSSASRAGYFEQAGDGTLFLDEIGELSPAIQVKLLRVLQQREVCRLGSNRPIPLHARVLFATHRDLNAMCNEGTFRKDLFYRVNVMNVHVPPLRERTGDIPILAMHFLKQYSAEYGKPVDDIQPNAMELLVNYDWPGNVRELENILQGAVIRANEASICQADLSETLRPAEPLSRSNSTTFDILLRQFKIDLINRTVEDCNGNKTLAARKLGLSRAYVHRLMRDGSVGDVITFPETA